MDWIEQVFGIDPDFGSGSLEILIAGAVLLIVAGVSGPLRPFAFVLLSTYPCKSASDSSRIGYPSPSDRVRCRKCLRIPRRVWSSSELLWVSR